MRARDQRNVLAQLISTYKSGEPGNDLGTSQILVTDRVKVTRDASLGESLQRELEGLDTPGDLVSTLLSPFAGVIVAIVLRLAVGDAGSSS